MIAPQELRIGNFVEVENYEIIQLENVHPKGTTKGDEIYLSSMLKPIELNEDWLLKFGFERHMIPDFLYKQILNDWIRIYFNPLHKICELSINGHSAALGKITSVHQLQNLTFSLTGEELKIKES